MLVKIVCVHDPVVLSDGALHVEALRTEITLILIILHLV
jgi:hypothetical protein